MRPAAIQGQCNGQSTAGGVFWRSECSDKTDMGANVITTGLFETLSAYLCVPRFLYGPSLRVLTWMACAQC